MPFAYNSPWEAEGSNFVLTLCIVLYRWTCPTCSIEFEFSDRFRSVAEAECCTCQFSADPATVARPASKYPETNFLVDKKAQNHQHLAFFMARSRMERMEPIEQLLERSLSRFPSARRFVTYGPTEAAVDTTTFEATGCGASASCVSIGQPDAFRILDLCHPELPELGVVNGSVGELRISGPGLARGYLEATAAFADAPRASGKRYASGDAVRWTKEGLEFLGRLDSQALLLQLVRSVKVRGQRIELEEVESVLKSCPGVTEAAVLLADDREEAVLVAFLSQERGWAP
eukprot:Skav219366  [mRNA]  locus=scaffold76:601894:609393:- [translate_table: standard]